MRLMASSESMPRRMLALSLRPRENSLRQILIEAAPEGLVGTFGIEIDGQEPVWLAGGILKQLVKAP